LKTSKKQEGGATGSPVTGPASARARISRRRFLERAGAGAAALGAAAAGLEGIAVAKRPDACSKSGYWEGDWYVVEGRGKHPRDVENVTCGLAASDQVLLRGFFNFGPNDGTGSGVIIDRPGVTVKGDGATIAYGGAKVPWTGWWYLFFVLAPDVSITDITFLDTADAAVVVNNEAGAGTVLLERNTCDCPYPFASLLSVDTILVIRNNVITGLCPLLFAQHLKSTPTAEADIVVEANTINCFDFWGFGTYLVWANRYVETGQIPDTYITNNDYYTDSIDGILVGDSAQVGQNVHIVGNRMSGNSMSAIRLLTDASNCEIIGNDLSGYTAFTAHMLVTGSNNLITQNTFGPCDGIDPFSSERHAVALWLLNINMHPNFTTANYPHGTPYLWTAGNRIIDNDYSRTGQPGFTGEQLFEYFHGLMMPVGGCIYTSTSSTLLFDHHYAPCPGLGMKNNYINESRFPAGTSVCDQLLQEDEYDSDIHRWDPLVDDEMFNARLDGLVEVDGEWRPLGEVRPFLDEPASHYLGDEYPENQSPAMFQKEKVVVRSPYSDYQTEIYMRKDPPTKAARPQNNTVVGWNAACQEHAEELAASSRTLTSGLEAGYRAMQNDPGFIDREARMKAKTEGLE
jgi:hypothetical protein